MPPAALRSGGGRVRKCGSICAAGLETREEKDMINKKLTAVIIAALAAFQCFPSCSGKKNGSSEAAKLSVVGGSELSGENYNSSEYYEKIEEKVNSAPLSTEPFELGEVGEIITPKAGSEEEELGNYRISSSGVKLYYEESEFPTELILTLEKYFTAFASADYTDYSRSVFPSYIAEMEAFLRRDFDYDLRTSFAKQCSGLADTMSGDYRITRIKLEPTEQYTEGEDNIDGYFEAINDAFGRDYYGDVKDNTDELIDACFYVMAENAYGEETMLVSGYEIVFAEKDGRYYTFG